MDSIQVKWQQRQVPGTDRRECVQVVGNEARSGDFVSGAFARYSQRWHQGSAKMWFTPMAVPRGAGPGTEMHLKVEAAKINDSAPPVIYEKARLARGIPDGTIFFATAFRLPSQGRWLLVATAGSNWGCFLFEFQ